MENMSRTWTFRALGLCLFFQVDVSFSMHSCLYCRASWWFGMTNSQFLGFTKALCSESDGGGGVSTSNVLMLMLTVLE
jgi:hypothetical protein